MGGGGKGKSESGSGIPPGFRSTTRNFGSLIGREIKSPGFQSSLNQGINYFNNFASNPDVMAAQDALRSQTEDPTKLTNPLFQQESERLGASLNEQARKRGGLYSTGGQEMVNRGLSTFTNQYLSEAAGRQQSAANSLYGMTQNIGQAMFTPFQALSSPLITALGRGPTPPPSFGNGKGQLYQTIGTLGGTAAMIAMGASDERLKCDITPLRPVEFTWGPEAILVGETPGNRGVGLIAQDVAKVWPDAVISRHGYLHINYQLVAARLLQLLQSKES